MIETLIMIAIKIFLLALLVGAGLLIIRVLEKIGFINWLKEWLWYLGFIEDKD